MNVVIVGGGVVGLSAALVCAKAGHHVRIFDPNGLSVAEPTGEIEPQVWALGPSATALLSRLNGWRDDPRVCAYQSMRVIDQTSDAEVRFVDPSLGHLVEANWVRCRLMDALASTPVKVVTERVLEVSPQGLVRLQSGEQTSCDLALFAEGKEAITARASGYEQVDAGYHQQAVVGTLAAQSPHRGEAFQSFTTRGPLALLPVAATDAAHRVSLVWSMRPPAATACRAMPVSDLEGLITEASESVRGTVQFVDSPIWIDLSQHYLKQDARGCCLAIGDTAHGILPLAGLGANLGFADVAALEQVFNTSPHCGGTRVARTVARMRRLPVQTVMTAMGVFSDSFHTDAPWMRLARSFAFRTASRHRQIRQLIQELAG
jgi:ubiquinone biosynthesis UbiH/UbiF/VisC/COQ6 family hydroxylase